MARLWAWDEQFFGRLLSGQSFNQGWIPWMDKYPFFRGHQSKANFSSHIYGVSYKNTGFEGLWIVSGNVRTKEHEWQAANWPPLTRRGEHMMIILHKWSAMRSSKAPALYWTPHNRQITSQLGKHIEVVAQRAVQLSCWLANTMWYFYCYECSYSATPFLPRCA